MRVIAWSGKAMDRPFRPPGTAICQRTTAAPLAKLLRLAVTSLVPGGNTGLTFSVVASSSAGTFHSTS